MKLPYVCKTLLITAQVITTPDFCYFTGLEQVLCNMYIQQCFTFI